MAERGTRRATIPEKKAKAKAKAAAAAAMKKRVDSRMAEDAKIRALIREQQRLQRIIDKQDGEMDEFMDGEDGDLRDVGRNPGSEKRKVSPQEGMKKAADGGQKIFEALDKVSGGIRKLREMKKKIKKKGGVKSLDDLNKLKKASEDEKD